jgi:CDP-diacylglycerol--serine O-phosphatidyltransferase
MFVWLQSPRSFDEFAFANWMIGLWALVVAALMISRIPTWSSKLLRLPPKMAMPVLGAAVLLIAALIQAPWQTLTVLSLAYMVHIPFAFRHFRRLQKEHADDEELADIAIGASAIDAYTEPPKGD